MHNILEIYLRIPRDDVYPGCPPYEIRNSISMEALESASDPEDLIRYCASRMYKQLTEETKYANSGNY